jgi:serine protease Do
MNPRFRFCALVIVLFCIPIHATARAGGCIDMPSVAAAAPQSNPQVKIQVEKDRSETADILLMPVAETEAAVDSWLAYHDFKSTHGYPRKGRVLIEAWRGGQHWKIRLSAHTPLATCIRITHEDGPLPDEIAAFRKYLNEYGAYDPEKKTSAKGTVPKVVRERLAAVVCVYAVEKENPLQLSGFCVDTGGLILSTAHDLELGQQVRLSFVDGHSRNGSVIKLDSQRDLCLIKVPERFPVVIPFHNGRFAPGLDEPLFAMGCPRGRSVTIRLGALDGPPRRVGGFPLWQARMRIEHGSSGGPVLDQRGRLTAVIKGRYRGTREVGFLIPFETLLNFMEDE